MNEKVSCHDFLLSLIDQSINTKKQSTDTEKRSFFLGFQDPNLRMEILYIKISLLIKLAEKIEWISDSIEGQQYYPRRATSIKEIQITPNNTDSMLPYFGCFSVSAVRICCNGKQNDQQQLATLLGDVLLFPSPKSIQHFTQSDEFACTEELTVPADLLLEKHIRPALSEESKNSQLHFEMSSFWNKCLHCIGKLHTEQIDSRELQIALKDIQKNMFQYLFTTSRIAPKTQVNYLLRDIVLNEIKKQKQTATTSNNQNEIPLEQAVETAQRPDIITQEIDTLDQDTDAVELETINLGITLPFLKRDI